MECAIALGSNAGDRLAHLRAAAAGLRLLDAGAEFSAVYETAPVDCPEGSGAFLNAAAILRWHGTPQELHAALRALEQSSGRPAIRERNAPRPLDLDVLTFGPVISTDPVLLLPHPRMTERRFVLQPLADLRPLMVPPGQSKNIALLLAALPQEPEEMRRCAAAL
jgi:2-amino-4-hydroxy-6-hydroxymethyldihydropteridine diphosphokinase